MYFIGFDNDATMPSKPSCTHIKISDPFWKNNLFTLSNFAFRCAVLAGEEEDAEDIEGEAGGGILLSGMPTKIETKE